MATIKPDYYCFNEHYNPEQMFYVVLDNQSFLSAYKRFNRTNARTIIEDFPMVLTIATLKPFKRNWTNENTNKVTYLKVVVGTKKETTHLGTGTLYQLTKI